MNIGLLIVSVTSVVVWGIGMSPAAAQPERPYPTGRATLDAVNAPRAGGGVVAGTVAAPTAQTGTVQNPCAGKNPCAAKASDSRKVHDAYAAPPGALTLDSIQAP